MPKQNKIELLDRHCRMAIKVARRARKNALPPVSEFQVGAAALTKRGNIFPGANFEEAALGSSIHAETSAISSANAAGDRNLKAIVVCADNLTNPKAFVTPCMHCWQFIHCVAEITGHPFSIILVHSRGNKAEIWTTAEKPPEPLSFSAIGIDLSKWRKK